jgi:predicted RNase H-like HicB family nuclease
MATMKTYTAVCNWVDGWWEITVPELDGRMTQAKHLSQVDKMVRSLVSLIDEIPANSFDITIESVLSGLASEVL